MRRFCACFCLLLTLCCSVSASAMVMTCEIPELYMQLDLPLRWVSLTRSTKAGDPGLYFYDDSLDTMLEVFEAEDLYLDAIDLESMLELVVVMTPSDGVFDLDLCGDDLVAQIAGDWAENPVWAGQNDVQCFHTGDYYQAGARFLTYYRTEVQDGVVLSCFQLSTVYNGQSIHLILTDFSDTLSFESGALAEAMFDISDTLAFTETLPPDGPSIGSISEDSDESFEFDDTLDAVIEVLAGLVPLMVVAVFFLLGRRSRVQRQRTAAAPRPVPMPPKNRQAAVPPARKPAAPPAIPPAVPAGRPHAAPVGRPVQPAPDPRPRHNYSSADGLYPLDRSNETVFCLDCGKKVFVRQKQCPYCGTRVV